MDISNFCGGHLDATYSGKSVQTRRKFASPFISLIIMRRFLFKSIAFDIFMTTWKMFRKRFSDHIRQTFEESSFTRFNHCQSYSIQPYCL